MLNLEELKKIGITDDQAKSIAELSERDETIVLKAAIDKKTGEIYGALEKDVLESSGIEKDQGERGYNYLKRALKEHKSLVDNKTDSDLKITSLNTKYDALVKKGGNESVLKDLDTERGLTKVLRQDLKDLEEKNVKNISDKDKEIREVMIDSYLDSLFSNISFKPDDVVDKGLKKLAMENAKRQVKDNNKISFDIKSNRIEFLDEDGQIRRDKKRDPITGLNLLKEAGLASIIDSGKDGSGSGGSGGKGGAGGKGKDASISSAKTKSEGIKLIREYVSGMGLVQGTQKYIDKTTELYKENNVADLPREVA